MATKTPHIVQEVAAFPPHRWMFRDVSVAQGGDKLPAAYEQSVDLFANADFISASDISNLGHLITELMVAWRGAAAGFAWWGTIGCKCLQL